MSSSDVVKMEFAVRMSSTSSEDNIRRVLQGTQGIQSTYVDGTNELVLVETALPVASVQELLEKTGHLVLFRGFGGTTDGTKSSAAVAITNIDNVKGLTRFLQADDKRCIVDGTVDGLHPGVRYYVRVRDFGDLSQGYKSCGNVYNSGAGLQADGELGTVLANTSGRAQFRYMSQKLKVADIIGRSLSIDSDDGKMACAVIARSAGIFENQKKFCSCDGVSQWDEAQKLKLT